ncbi:MAG: maleylpyruvate isomerase N-terminal domain-containing protein, partial [Actinomycetota bacterium]|nr:maleylpyruvate isomerase N-terminal domain-containing protein [Actinomycetota bacterium]
MDVQDVAADLVAEQQALDEVVAGLDAADWAAPTPSAGWAVSDQVAHLTYFDRAAATAITEPEAFRASV